MLVPTAPRDLQLSLTQLDPPIVLVTWTRPLHSHGPLTGYKLTYGVVGDSYIEERRFDSEKFRFTTGFLGVCVCVSVANCMTSQSILVCSRHTARRLCEIFLQTATKDDHIHYTYIH